MGFKVISSELNKAAVFSILFVVLFLILNSVFISLVYSKSIEFRTQQMTENFLKYIPQETLNCGFFGTSHTRNAINPQYITNSFNFSQPRDSFKDIYFKIESLVYQKKIKIKNIFLEIDQHNFTGFYSDDLIFKDFYFTRFDGRDVFTVPEKDDLTKVIKGWHPLDGNEFFELSSVKKYEKAQIIFEIIKGKNFLNQENLDYFEKILQLAEKNNIKVALIKLPAHESFDWVLKTNKFNFIEYYGKIYEIANRNLDNYIVLDFYKKFDNFSEYFYDPTHINFLGSKLISTDKEIQKICSGWNDGQ